jgi:hypothetical protein
MKTIILIFVLILFGNISADGLAPGCKEVNYEFEEKFRVKNLNMTSFKVNGVEQPIPDELITANLGGLRPISKLQTLKISEEKSEDGKSITHLQLVSTPISDLQIKFVKK